jgi:hypothetical protein
VRVSWVNLAVGDASYKPVHLLKGLTAFILNFSRAGMNIICTHSLKELNIGYIPLLELGAVQLAVYTISHRNYFSGLHDLRQNLKYSSIPFLKLLTQNSAYHF